MRLIGNHSQHQDVNSCRLLFLLYRGFETPGVTAVEDVTLCITFARKIREWSQKPTQVHRIHHTVLYRVVDIFRRGYRRTSFTPITLLEYSPRTLDGDGKIPPADWLILKRTSSVGLRES